MKHLTMLSGFILCLCFSAITVSAQTDKEKDDYFIVVEEMPSFPGGQDSMFSYIGRNVAYPDEAAANKIQGRVIISFIIEKDGSLSNANVVKGVHESLDAEALRVINAMPRWTPGKQNDVPVRVKVTLPIMYRI